MDSRKELFDLIARIGETLDGKIHIINLSDEHPVYDTDKNIVFITKTVIVWMLNVSHILKKKI